MDSNSITRLLNSFGRGERDVEDALLGHIYDELHGLAAHYLGGQQPGHTLQPTALINEAWMKLVRQEELAFDGRAQFYGLASRVMRSILVDHARRTNREKRVGPGQRVALDLHDEGAPAMTARSLEILALEDGLAKLEALKPKLSRVVEMRFYGGLTHAEIASALGVSERTVERNWRAARAFLSTELGE